MIGCMSDTDFKDFAGNLPAEVRFRHFPPMWPYPSTAVNNSTDNITFGMDATHLCVNLTTDKDALIAQCPIVCFKASTVLQSMGTIASRTFLPSSDVQGELRECTHCPTTWLYAYAYDTPAQYSDALFEKGALPILAHECVLPVIVKMSNKDKKHAQCANGHAPSSVVSGMMVSRTPYETFLFPETDDSKCPVNKHARKLSKDEANECIKLIQLRVPKIDKKDKRAYCPYRGPRHEEPAPLDMPPLLQVPEQERQALMHIVRRRSSSFSLPPSSGQWRNCDAQLGTARP